MREFEMLSDHEVSSSVSIDALSLLEIDADSDLPFFNLIGLLRSLPRLSPSLLLIALRSIKHLSTSQPLLDVLQNADAIRTLIDLLGGKIGAPGMNVSTYEQMSLVIDR